MAKCCINRFFVCELKLAFWLKEPFYGIDHKNCEYVIHTWQFCLTNIQKSVLFNTNIQLSLNFIINFEWKS